MPIPRSERAQMVVSLALTGMRPLQIAREVGVSRQRVHQILARAGVSTPRIIKPKPPSKAERQAVELGCPLPLYNALVRMEGAPIAKYKTQRQHAARRGIEWGFTLETWWAVWERSGKWPLRGRRLGEYVMARVMDLGAYAPDNVRIKTSSANGHEYQDRWKRRRVHRASSLTVRAFAPSPLDELIENGDVL